jgi:hypothetical protein
MRRISCAVDVRLVAGRLHEIYWNKAVYQVEDVQLLCIREGRWWLDVLRLRGTSRVYFRVVAARPRQRAVVMELYKESERYMLARVAD